MRRPNPESLTQTLLRAVHAHPGLGLRDLLKAAGIAQDRYMTASALIAYLAKQGKVQSIREPGRHKARYFPAGAKVEPPKRQGPPPPTEEYRKFRFVQPTIETAFKKAAQPETVEEWMARTGKRPEVLPPGACSKPVLKFDYSPTATTKRKPVIRTRRTEITA
jgi:hypothetical protein